ncbi:gibberellin 3-beta-dioxygenase 1-like [Punica granatum]|uniref:gibberellin 3beta-dioxygenase n=2 Tax=Punica granatum TaxID=22663 RepID=A0A218X1K3_PUNGR|nr:gibberellin 3-beta-dioxygenase 1-like [Punica granatum]OWM78222.1 hypothetical protein CDL15_Pgr015041 [Punica granatum]PKI43310.1 hypothetical protein CRG98_036290 [Punica granatum]
MPSRISDVFRAHPVHLHQKQYLDFNSVKELPESYAWAKFNNDYPSSVASSKEESVPVIDLHHPNALTVMGHACRTWGVFQVINHGVPEDILHQSLREGKNLFSLPMQQKLKAARSPGGISGYGVARIAPFFEKLMWSEGFTIVGSPLEHAQQLWPHDYTGFCDVIREYKKEMKKLAGRLMWLVLGSLGISKEDLKWAGPRGDFSGAAAALQLNSYPACPDPDRAMGLGVHTDSTLLTILLQNNTSGLQVLKEGSGWINVPPIPGALVINLGDMLQILSNGLYQSVPHRAVVNRTQQRLSIAYLYGPPDSVLISPIPKLVGPACPPIYRSVTWTEYLQRKAKYFNRGLSSVRIHATKNGLQDVNDKIV